MGDWRHSSSLVTLGIRGDKWAASRSGCFDPEERISVPTGQGAESAVSGQDSEEKNSSPPGFEPLLSIPKGSHCID